MAAERYWKGTKKPGENTWSVGALTRRARIDPAVLKTDKAALRLIGALRRYHAHLTLPASLTAEEIATGGSTRPGASTR
jgi:hypothetical protein